MTCSDWQFRIASESEDPALAEHLTGCEACRAFARDVAEYAAALRAIEVGPAAYVAVRARVLAAVRPRRRFAWMWAAGVAAAVACAVVVWFAVPRAAGPPPPPAVAHFAPPPELPASPPIRTAARTVPRRTRPRPLIARAPAGGSLTAIKLLTDDPNVVIIWLVDKKGDSL